MKPIRVVIADDEPIARRGIRHLLARHLDVDIVGEARNGKEAVRLLKTLVPDLVFLDVQMPELDGFAVLREIAPDRMPDVNATGTHPWRRATTLTSKELSEPAAP